jgi:hypothetical protein
MQRRTANQRSWYRALQVLLSIVCHSARARLLGQAATTPHEKPSSAREEHVDVFPSWERDRLVNCWHRL